MEWVPSVWNQVLYLGNICHHTIFNGFLFVTKCSFGFFRDDSTQFKENQPQRLEQHGNLVPVASCQLY